MPSKLIDDIPGVRGRLLADGSASYQITTSHGRDGLGGQKRRYLTYNPPPGETKRETRKALERMRAELQNELHNPNSKESCQTVAQFSEVFLADKEAAGCKPNTLRNYREALKRINAVLGNIPLNQITTAEIDHFYRSLAKEESRRGQGAVALPALRKAMTARKLSRMKLAELAGLGASTVNNAVKGERVSRTTARRLAEALGREVNSLFILRQGGEALSSESVLSHHRVLRSMLALAKKKKLVRTNEAEDATLPKRPKRKARTLQPEEIAKLLQAMEAEPLMWQALVHMALVTGARRGELAGLQWSNIDFEEGTVTIDHALLYDSEKGVYTGSTKTGQDRYNKLPDQTLNLLRRWKRQQAEIALKLGDRWQRSGYLFTGDTGSHLHPDSISSYVSRLGEKYDIPGLHTHLFRHTAASIMIGAGVDLVTVAGHLGHADANTTAGIYAHAIAQRKAAASGAIGSAIYQTADKKQA